MRLLLDTHAFLWFVLNDSRLSSIARSAIANPDNTVLFSPASYWEIAIKISVGKYSIPGGFAEFIQQQIDGNDFTIQPVLVSHAAQVASLPFHHRDPFDRLLIAQSIVENVPLVSADGTFDEYSIDRIW